MLFRTRDLEGFLKVFTFSKKRALERYCRDTTVYGCDFANVIVACEDGVLPFRHRIHYSDIVPKHLVPTDASLGAVSRNSVGPLDREGRKAARKIFALFDERRWLVGHILEGARRATGGRDPATTSPEVPATVQRRRFSADMHEWHFFCPFDQRDTAARANHWKGGSHIHLVNWLWPNLDLRSVWRDFVRKNERPPQALHLRYNDEPPDQPSLSGHSRA